MLMGECERNIVMTLHKNSCVWAYMWNMHHDLNKRHPIIPINSLRPRRNERYNTEDIFKCIFLKENVWIPTKISQKFVPKGPINNIPALVQIMAWRRPGDKPLSEPMMASLLTHICVTRPQWVKVSCMVSNVFCTNLIMLYDTYLRYCGFTLL